MIHKIMKYVKRIVTRDRIITRQAPQPRPARQKNESSRAILWQAGGSLRVLEVT